VIDKTQDPLDTEIAKEKARNGEWTDFDRGYLAGLAKAATLRPSPASPAPQGADVLWLEDHLAEINDALKAGESRSIKRDKHIFDRAHASMDALRDLLLPPAPAPGAEAAERKWPDDVLYTGAEIRPFTGLLSTFQSQHKKCQGMNPCKLCEEYEDLNWSLFLPPSDDPYHREMEAKRRAVTLGLAALAPVASPPAPADCFDSWWKIRWAEAANSRLPSVMHEAFRELAREAWVMSEINAKAHAAAPLAPDPLPAGLGSPLDVLGAAIERDIGMQLNGDTITDRYVALKGIVHEILGRAPTPPESGAPNLREAVDRAFSAGIEFALAKPERTNEWAQERKDQIIRSLDERSESGEQREPAPIPSHPEPGEKDQDGSGKPVAGAGAPSEGEDA